jgi:hypothetical protein
MLQESFGITMIPSYVLLDREGIERLRVSGMTFDRSSELKNALEKLLGR